MTEQYTLTCEKCGQPYISSEGFPRLQWCPSCSKGQFNLEILREKIARKIFPVLYLEHEAYEVDIDTKRALGLTQQILSLEPLATVVKLLDLLVKAQAGLETGILRGCESFELGVIFRRRQNENTK